MVLSYAHPRAPSESSLAKKCVLARYGRTSLLNFSVFGSGSMTVCADQFALINLLHNGLSAIVKSRTDVELFVRQVVKVKTLWTEWPSAVWTFLTSLEPLNEFLELLSLKLRNDVARILVPCFVLPIPICLIFLHALDASLSRLRDGRWEVVRICLIAFRTM